MNLLTMPRPFARTVAATLLAGGLLFAGAASASAHVRVVADDATAGGFSVLTFRVPNESDTAGTVKVEATLPNDTPFLYVSSKPVPGWKATMAEAALPSPVDVQGTKITKAIRTVTWTADKGTQIGPGEFQEFEISVGPLPAAGTVSIPATQTYSDGKVVNWNQPTPDSGDEPANPVPTFTIAAASSEDNHGSEASSSPSVLGSPAAAPVTPAAIETSSADPVARVLGGIGLVAGIAALVVALVGRRRGTA